MAYVEKYDITFKQVKDYDGYDGWIIAIYQDGFVGSKSVLKTKQDSIVLKREGEPFEHINGTKLNFELYNLTEGQFLEFRDATWGEYYCKVYRSNGDVLFYGYNQSEIYTESYDQPPYTAKLEFTCGLKHLKYKRFSNGAELYSGQKSIIEVLRLCLNQLPYPLSIRENVNLYEDSINSTTTDSMINQIYVDTSLYRETKNGVVVGMNCYEVIENLMKPFVSHIHHVSGKWYVSRVQEYIDSTIYYREFLPRVGTESTITVDSTGNTTTNKRVATVPNGLSTELIIVSPETEMSIEVPLNRILLKYNQNINGTLQPYNLLYNWDFALITSNSYTGYPTGWTVVGDSPNTYNAIIQNNYFSFKPATQDTLAAPDYTRYLYHENLNVFINSADVLDFRMAQIYGVTCTKTTTSPQMSTILPFLQTYVRIWTEIELKVGSYYWNGSAWSTTQGTFRVHRNTGTGSSYQSQSPIIATWGDTTSFATLTDALPTSGFVDITIKIFIPYHNVEAYDTSISDWDIELDFIGIKYLELNYRPSNVTPENEYTVYQEIDEDEEIIDLEIMHGDGLYDQSVGSFRLSTGEVTNNWNRRGLTDNYSIFTMILKQYAQMRGAYQKLLSGTVYGQFSSFNTIEHTVNAIATHYYIKDYTYHIETNEWELNLAEMFTTPLPDPPTPVVNQNFRLLEPPTPSNTNTTFEPVDSDNMIIEDDIISEIDTNNLFNFI